MILVRNLHPIWAGRRSYPHVDMDWMSIHHPYIKQIQRQFSSAPMVDSYIIGNSHADAPEIIHDPDMPRCLRRFG